MYKNILIPVVPDHLDGARRALNAARLLADEGAKFTVIHVLEDIPGYVRGQISSDILKQRHADLDQSVSAIAAELPGADAHLLTGHAGQTITHFAGEHAIDCIILSSHTPRIEDFFIGSTASRVVNHAPCSVHVIR